LKNEFFFIYERSSPNQTKQAKMPSHALLFPSRHPDPLGIGSLRPAEQWAKRQRCSFSLKPSDGHKPATLTGSFARSEGHYPTGGRRGSSEVIKSYIEYSATPYQPTGPDIISLKAHNVSDEIVTLLLKRGAQVRAAIAQARSDALARALSARKGPSGLDPESYDYFRYYYLQPRALASAYERLFPYYNPSFASPFAYPPSPAVPGNQPFLNH
jgi:hypothetical protein